jgi:glutaredoxin
MNKLTVYSMMGCSQCVQAAAYLTSKEIPHELVKLEDSPEAWELMKKDNRRSMPQIYLNNSLFVEGGFQGLSKMSKEEIMKKLEG